ncbi:hypothetical protein K435DRAFT_855934 [Dendrothele bispora CBS 962.96]|uniref:Uncharacterized protein n=1 Tax=Dendrothele bispora (strain CBS 962.96) TaxID=1314807 RepID=A0A4S8MA32_DENBC|nr:hypothetical protein K435DRAFT_855934 [Dendrothele bispora CBS 962.96]
MNRPKEYIRCSRELGETALNFHSSIAWYLNRSGMLVFILRAVQQPSSIPMSIASLNLITSTATGFSNKLLTLFDQSGNIADQWAEVRRFYEILAVENHVKDG